MKRLSLMVAAGALVLAVGYLVSFERFPGSIIPGHSAIAIAEAAESLRVDAEQPVVVELFTSQGCYSCPPADALLGKLAKKPGVLALSFHVDYWDYIGWKDTFASPQFTKRQRSYARELSLRYVYTPQMVIDGTTNVVGSRTGEVIEAIEEAAQRDARVGVEFVPTPRHGALSAGSVIVEAGTAPTDGEAVVWLVMFDDKHQTDIARGENAGKQLSYHNVVRELRQIGSWQGARLEIDLDLGVAQAEGRDGCAILVQERGTGRIIGAAIMDFDPT